MAQAEENTSKKLKDISLNTQNISQDEEKR
jgi:hypothetical protein